MVTPKQLRAAVLPIFALLTVASSIGCSSLQSNQATEPLATGSETVTVSDPMIVVELRNGDNHEYLRAPLKESMLVQDALKGAGAVHRFKRMDVVLVRQSPSGEKLRLPVHFNASTRRVVDENNYALHGGDWLEVSKDTSTTFDRMIEQAMEPFKPVMRSYRG